MKGFGEDGEEVLRQLREETQEAVQAMIQAVADSVKQTHAETRKDGLVEEEEPSDDASSTSTSGSEQSVAVPVQVAEMAADPEQSDDKVTSCASSKGSRDTVETVIRVAVSNFAHSDSQTVEPTVVEEEEQWDAVDSKSTGPAAASVEETGLVVDSGRPEEYMVTPCSSSGATALGETEAQAAGSDVREANGDKLPGKLRRRERLLRKLHLRWLGRKSNVIADSHS
ncbi:hypothetical protein PG994_006592 [Apiospora phragmitis]|uniref:Uncharacterized protein n=1 Tax=Apiospora phragmitis TaxID=2905665 RepID=A0ABR1VFF7_9PEZI